MNYIWFFLKLLWWDFILEGETIWCLWKHTDENEEPSKSCHVIGHRCGGHTLPHGPEWYSSEILFYLGPIGEVQYHVMGREGKFQGPMPFALSSLWCESMQCRLIIDIRSSMQRSAGSSCSRPWRNFAGYCAMVDRSRSGEPCYWILSILQLIFSSVVLIDDCGGCSALNFSCILPLLWGTAIMLQSTGNSILMIFLPT